MTQAHDAGHGHDVSTPITHAAAPHAASHDPHYDPRHVAHDPLVSLHPEPYVSKMTVVHTIIGFVLSFGGLFTMMTVAYAALGATLAVVGVTYITVMWMIGLSGSGARQAGVVETRPAVDPRPVVAH